MFSPWMEYISPAPNKPKFNPILRSRSLGITRVADPDPGSGAFFTPGSGIRKVFSGSRISDPGSRIPKPYFWKLSDNFLRKMFYNSLKIGLNFFLQHFKTKIIFYFVKFVATEKGMTTIFFHPSLLWLFLDPGSEIRDPGSGIRDPGLVKIRIRDKHPGSATLGITFITYCLKRR